LAVVPWVALHLAAYRDRPGELYTYYAFPFLIVAAWPFAVHALRMHHGNGSTLRASGDAVPPVAWVAVALVGLLAYLFPPFALDAGTGAQRRASLSSFLPKVSRGDAELVTRFANAYEKLLGSSNHLVLLDEAVRSLLPQSRRLDLYARSGVPVVPSPGEPFVIAYFRTYEQSPEIESVYQRLASDCFRVEGTNIRILSSGSRALIEEGVGIWIAEVSCDDFASNAKATDASEREWNGSRGPTPRAVDHG
jgi:hypothetical protein